jgi:hypothetical protein
MSNSIRDLRDSTIDQTLQNLLRALTLNLELRSLYRVFEYEAKHDGRSEMARLFGGLWLLENEPIAELVGGLRVQLDQLYVPGSEGA